MTSVGPSAGDPGRGDEKRLRLARALADFWAGGGGPTRADIDRVLDRFDLADDIGGSKRTVVDAAVCRVRDGHLQGLLSALVDLLAEQGYFAPGEAPAPIAFLRKRLNAYGLVLSEDWSSSEAQGSGSSRRKCWTAQP